MAPLRMPSAMLQQQRMALPRMSGSRLWWRQGPSLSQAAGRVRGGSPHLAACRGCSTLLAAAAVGRIRRASTAIVAVSRSEPEADGATIEHRRKVDAALQGAWDGLDRALRDDGGSHGLNSAVDDQARTYGEVTVAGARHLSRAMGLDAAGTSTSQFLDMGSGCGKLVAQAYLEWPAVKRSVGIELCPERTAQAQQAWSKLVASGAAAGLRGTLLQRAVDQVAVQQEVELIQGDLLDADISQATHIFVSSLCFGEELLAEVTRKLGREASALRCAATLTALPQSRAAGLRYRGSVFAEMTWTGVEGTRVWLYELRSSRSASLPSRPRARAEMCKSVERTGWWQPGLGQTQSERWEAIAKRSISGDSSMWKGFKDFPCVLVDSENGPVRWFRAIVDALQRGARPVVEKRGRGTQSNVRLPEVNGRKAKEKETRPKATAPAEEEKPEEKQPAKAPPKDPASALSSWFSKIEETDAASASAPADNKRIKELEKQLEELKRTHEAADLKSQRRIVELLEASSSKQKLADQADQERKDFESKLEELKKKLRAKEAQSEEDDERSSKLSREAHEARMEVEKERTRAESAERERDRIATELKRLEATAKQRSQEQEEQDKQVERLKARVKALREEADHAEEERRSMQAKVDEMRATHAPERDAGSKDSPSHERSSTDPPAESHTQEPQGTTEKVTEQTGAASPPPAELEV
eukprot:s15_g6.t4